MLLFTAILQKFAAKGDKTGWTYIDIPTDVAEAMRPGVRTTYRVRGQLDDHVIDGVALLPMGDSTFILPVNAVMRRAIGKEAGQSVQVRLALDESPPPESADLLACLADDERALTHFRKLARSHQQYFINWIEGAKTPATKDRRLAQAVRGLSMGMDYGETIRYFRQHPDNIS